MLARLKNTAWLGYQKTVERIPAPLAIESLVRVLPRIFEIEATNHCNHKCPLCPHDSQPRDRGMLDADKFGVLLKEIEPFASTICFSVLGESLMHPQIFEMIRMAEDLGIPCSLMTNGQLVEEHIEGILDSGLTKLKVTIDGADSETHTRYRIGADFDRIQRGVEKLCRAKRERGLALPHVRIDSLLFRYNIGQQDAIREWANSVGADGVNFRAVWIATPSIAGESQVGLAEKWLPEEPSLNIEGWSDEGFARDLRVCPTLHRTTILWNGDVVPCGRCSWDGAESFGNVFTDGGFRAVWESDRHREVLASLMRREFDRCRDCHMLDGCS